MLLDTARHDPWNNVINNHEGRGEVGGGVGVRRWRGKGRGGGEEKWSVEIDRQGGEVGGEGDTEKDRKTQAGRRRLYSGSYTHTHTHVRTYTN